MPSFTEKMVFAMPQTQRWHSIVLDTSVYTWLWNTGETAKNNLSCKFVAIDLKLICLCYNRSGGIYDWLQKKMSKPFCWKTFFPSPPLAPDSLRKSYPFRSSTHTSRWAARNPDFFLFTVCSVWKNLQHQILSFCKSRNPDWNDKTWWFSNFSIVQCTMAIMSSFFP